MKTRIKLHLIIYIAFAGLFMACENEIPYNPGQQNPQLIMNALLNAGQTENLVSSPHEKGAFLWHPTASAASMKQHFPST